MARKHETALLTQAEYSDKKEKISLKKKLALGVGAVAAAGAMFAGNALNSAPEANADIVIVYDGAGGGNGDASENALRANGRYQGDDQFWKPRTWSAEMGPFVGATPYDESSARAVPEGVRMVNDALATGQHVVLYGFSAGNEPTNQIANEVVRQHGGKPGNLQVVNEGGPHGPTGVYNSWLVDGVPFVDVVMNNLAHIPTHTRPIDGTHMVYSEGDWFANSAANSPIGWIGQADMMSRFGVHSIQDLRNAPVEVWEGCIDGVKVLNFEKDDNNVFTTSGKNLPWFNCNGIANAGLAALNNEAPLAPAEALAPPPPIEEAVESLVPDFSAPSQSSAPAPAPRIVEQAPLTISEGTDVEDFMTQFVP